MMIKKWSKKILKFIILASLFIVAFGKIQVRAEEALTLDPDGFWRVSTYEDLQKATNNNWPYHRLRLTEDIIVSDSENDRKLVFNGDISVTIDLNGYTIQRTTRSLDTSLFHIMNGAILTIRDSSEEQTGEVNFINHVSRSAYNYLLNSNESILKIFGGTHRVEAEGASYGANVCAEGGTVEIYGGVFDCRESGGNSNNISMCRLNYLVNAPRCIIFDGTFYAKYNNLEISPVSMMQGNSIYSSIYVLDGEFYLNRYDKEENYGGFAYCNNGWGRVIVANGKTPWHSLNKSRDLSYVSGATKKTENYTFDGCTQPYEIVKHPPLIVSETLPKDLRLLDLCSKAEAQWYVDHVKPGGSFDQMYGEVFREILQQKAEIFVDAYTYESPELKLEGVGVNDRIEWYGAYDYDGENASWQKIGTMENQAGPWRPDMRPEENTTYYIKACVYFEDGGFAQDIITIHYEKINKILQGNPMIYMNNPYFGNRLYAGIFNAPSWQKKSSYIYEWKMNGVVVGTEEIFTLDDPSYIGKSLNCTIRSTEYQGALTTNTVVVRKAANNGKPVTPSASYDAAAKSITLSFLRDDQEYLFSEKESLDELTEDDWVWSKKPESGTGVWKLSYIDLQHCEGELIYIYTRFKETETGRAGDHVIGVPLMLAKDVWLKDLSFRDSVEGKIYIPFTGRGEEVILYYDVDPLNANQWNNFSWVNPGWPVKLAAPLETVTAENNTGTVRLELISPGTTDLVAYSSNGNQVKRQTIVVYDPENPSIGNFNVVTPLKDHTMEVGTVYVPEMPQMIPEPPENMEFRWFFTDLTDYDQPLFTECEAARINSETGEIQGLFVGHVTVALVRADGDDYYRLATFELTVRGSGTLIQVKEILISQTELTLQPRENAYLEVVVLPANASNQSVAWTTSDERIASVETNGRVRGISEGTATITATAGGKSISCSVTVTKDLLSDIRVPVTEVFSDIVKGQWYIEAVQYVYDNGLMSGSKGLFKPNENITREQVVATLHNMEGNPKVSNTAALNAMKDVKAGQWYTDAVGWAYSAGVATGNSSTKLFGVGNPITRQQLAVMLFNYAKIKGYDTTARGDYSKLKGANEVASYAVNAMKWAYGTGLISGSKTTVGGTTVYNLNPTGNATRAQMASILKQFCEAYGI